MFVILFIVFLIIIVMFCNKMKGAYLLHQSIQLRI